MANRTGIDMIGRPQITIKAYPTTLLQVLAVVIDGCFEENLLASDLK